MLLPHPDSPTSARVSLRATEKLTSRIASYQRPSTRNAVVRPSTTRGSCRASLMTKPRIGGVAKAIAQHVEAEHDDEDRDARKDRQPRRIEDVLEALADHPAPGRSRRPHAETDEGERRLGSDRGRQPQRRHDQDIVHHVGQNVNDHDAQVRETQRAAASTKSRSLTVRVGARAMRAKGATAVSVIARIRLPTVGPSMATTSSPMTSVGNDSSTSIAAMSTRSNSPPM